MLETNLVLMKCTSNQGTENDEWVGMKKGLTSSKWKKLVFYSILNYQEHKICEWVSTKQNDQKKERKLEGSRDTGSFMSKSRLRNDTSQLLEKRESFWKQFLKGFYLRFCCVKFHECHPSSFASTKHKRNTCFSPNAYFLVGKTTCHF